ncbi:MAG: YitT family protein [Bacteroidaceae bacterium]|nr:YitT family protein [Bacteroidaceae bacterium]MBO7588383.1 YitT family protein [Bacteroidaceae bacterium]MBP5647406.1 YitT family protein [Bacteroidaceae bacterium]
MDMKIRDAVKTALKAVKTWTFWKELIIMTLGMMISAAAVNYFLIPSKLIVGSISGLSIVISGIFELFSIPVKVSTIIVIINAILLIMAYLLIDREFGIKTVYTALILGPLMDLWEMILPSSKLMTDGSTSVMGDIWLDLCCFVLLLSAAQAILFHINASTGGLDILAKIVNKYLHFDIGASISVAGAVICCTAFIINPFRMVVVGLIGTWINGIVVDYFTASINKRKRVCIISSSHEILRRYIIEELDRGCSLYQVTGGYSGKENTEIQALLTQDEFSKLMDFMKKNDIHGFITAGNVSEIYGLWNKHKHGPIG